MRTDEIQYRSPVTVPREMTIQRAAQLMDHEGVGSLLVMEADELVGIVTDRDLALRVVARGVPVDGRIDAVMTCGVVTVPRPAGRDEIARVFAEHAVRRLPVVDNGDIVGLVALDDLLADATGPDMAGLAATVAREVRHPHHEAGLPVPMEDTRRRLGARQARVGDQVVIHSRGGVRDGEVLEVSSPAGDPPFLVRWSDGRLSYIYPGDDATVRHLAQATHHS